MLLIPLMESSRKISLLAMGIDCTKKKKVGSPLILISVVHAPSCQDDTFSLLPFICLYMLFWHGWLAPSVLTMSFPGPIEPFLCYLNSFFNQGPVYPQCSHFFHCCVQAPYLLLLIVLTGPFFSNTPL